MQKLRHMRIFVYANKTVIFDWLNLVASPGNASRKVQVKPAVARGAGGAGAMAGNARMKIDIVFDVVCPLCVIGYFQLRAALESTAIPAEIHWHPFELNPHMVPGGENLAAKYGPTPQASRQA